MKVLNRAMVSGMVALGAAAVSGAAAFACTALATIDSQVAAAPVGSSVALSGAAFSASAATPVIWHWNGVNGPEVARATPDAAGNVSASFTVLQADAGYYTMVATQTNAKGEAVYGTPARLSFQVVGPDGRAPVAPAVTPPPPVGPTATDSGGVVALTVVLGAAGLALFGAGAASMARQNRRQAKPVAAPVRHD